MNETTTTPDEHPTFGKQPLKKRPAPEKKHSAPKVYQIPPMSEEERVQAENQRVADAFALVEEKQREFQARKAECWRQMIDIAAQYGFELTATHQPVSIIVDLQPIQGRA